MSFFTINILLDFVGFVIALAIIIYTYFKWTFQHWERKGVPYVRPSIPFGNIDNPLTRTRNFGTIIKDVYDELKAKNARFGGCYMLTTPGFIPIDPDIVRNILTKDFKYFHERGFYYNEKGNPLSAHIFAVGGAKWKFLRTKLTPTFTSGKMKLMFHTIVGCTDGLVKAIEKQAIDQSPIDIKEVLGCFTTDIIGSCAFGLECNSFAEENSEFRRNGREIFTPSLKNFLRSVFSTSYPELARKLNVYALGGDQGPFFFDVVKSNYEYRLKNNFARNDFFQLLIDIKKECEKSGETFSIENLAAQCFLFFIAGFETSSTTTTFTLFELAKNLEIQDKARRDVKEVLGRHDGKITYEAIQEMKYLRCVLDEALRMYPPLPAVPRTCTEDYIVPDTNVIIEKGTTIMVPILGLHRDPEYFPEPEKFNPDRFNEQNIGKLTPYTYIPFGYGPRNCLGLRFGVIQSMVGLATLLSNFEFTVNPKTQMPFRFNPKSFIMSTDGEMWLTARKLK